MENTFTLKQILFALRKEYLEVEKKLKELENYVKITGEIDDISFHIHDFSTRKTIDMYLSKKQTILDKIREIVGLNGIYTRGIAFWMIPEEIDAACYWKRKKVCSFTDIDELSKSINNIIDNKFINSMRITTLNTDNNLSLNIAASGTSLIENKNNFCLLDYNPDSININTKENIITPTYIDNLLNIKFSKENFNDYYKEILDNYEEKEIDITDTIYSDHAELEIIEKPKKIILTPKRNI